ncbi:DUF5677 domain-containing protein [Geomonas edaphica]|uniref:DUF5677 domain-containing protein n=1 Tax=Geomonas edaphica TaxID=2570226 RepID=UPI0010A8974B|nr:DUF5677 domain-containing protein [Geomonas edaphica]
MHDEYKEKFVAVITFYEKLIPRLIDYAASFTFDGTHILHITLVSLYGSILELGRSLLPLLTSESYSAIPIVLRSILEAYVDLENICKDPTYGYSMDIKALKEELAFLDEAKKDNNVYMRIIAEAPDLDERIAGIKAERKRLLDRGFKDLNKFDRFTKAGLENEYRTIYNWLCCASHNDQRELRRRHLEKHGEGVKIHLFKEADYAELESHFGVASELLVRASIAIHNLLNSPKQDDMKGLREEMDKLRREIYGEDA